MVYSTIKTGSKYSDTFKMFFEKDGKIISPFHEIELKVGSFYNAVIEIPRFESAKFEINLKELMNPITQDIKKGKVRFVKNIYPFCGFPFNYGAFPQTFEDPAIKCPVSGTFGDNDPLDVVDIGSTKKITGGVYQVKVLGCLQYIDDSETDWKMIVIDSEDPLCSQISDIDDVEKHLPGLLKDIKRWYTDYKVPDGKPKGLFGYGGEYLNAEFAKKVIEENHISWKKLLKIEPSSISTLCSTDSHLVGGPFIVKEEILPDSEKPSSTSSFTFVE